MRLLLILLSSFIPHLFGSMAESVTEAEIVGREGKDYALFFAINDYRAHPNYQDLLGPIFSAKAIAKELNDMYAFEVRLFKNPTKDDIYEVLEQYHLRNFGPNDQLFVFFSGHGEFNEFEKKGYFVPQSGPSIDLTTLGNIISGIPCKHILLAIDACFSGTIDKEIAYQGRYRGRIGDNDENARQKIISEQLQNKSQLLLTSGAKFRTPSQKDGSPFAKAILSTLRRSYIDGKGLVTYKDLEAAMERVSPKPYSGKLFEDENGGFVFVKGIANTSIMDETWMRVKEVNRCEVYQYFRVRFRQGPYSTESKARELELGCVDITLREKRATSVYLVEQVYEDLRQESIAQRTKRYNDLIVEQEFEHIRVNEVIGALIVDKVYVPSSRLNRPDRMIIEELDRFMALPLAHNFKIVILNSSGADGVKRHLKDKVEVYDLPK